MYINPAKFQQHWPLALSETATGWRHSTRGSMEVAPSGTVPLEGQGDNKVMSIYFYLSCNAGKVETTESYF